MKMLRKYKVRGRGKKRITVIIIFVLIFILRVMPSLRNYFKVATGIKCHTWGLGNKHPPGKA